MPVDQKGTIRIHAGTDVLGRAAAGAFTQAARKALKSKEYFSVVLAGGSSPIGTYELLARPPYRDLVQWKKVHVFWGDERCVPADHPRNNARSAMEALLNHVPVPKDQIHPIPTDQPPERSAELYEALLRKFFSGGRPRFDLILLGLGEDCHTASLFPDSPVLGEQQRWVKEVFPDRVNEHRVTLTVPLIVQATEIVFIVSGKTKAEALKKVLEGPENPHKFPAQLIRPTDGELVWLVDEDAARELYQVKA